MEKGSRTCHYLSQRGGKYWGKSYYVSGIQKILWSI